GIRDFHVTGVQTCALPICRFFLCRQGTLQLFLFFPQCAQTRSIYADFYQPAARIVRRHRSRKSVKVEPVTNPSSQLEIRDSPKRSEERSGGKESNAQAPHE